MPGKSLDPRACGDGAPRPALREVHGALGHPSLLYEVERYARTINSLFTQHKPHDDRHPEEQRRDALYTSFYVLKTLMVMLRRTVRCPRRWSACRESLRPFTCSASRIPDPSPRDTQTGPKGQYFPAVAGE